MVVAFAHPTDRQKSDAVTCLSDADLVGRYWRLADLTALTSAERRRLMTYRYETLGYESYCEDMVAHRPRQISEVSDLSMVLDRWDTAFFSLRLWHHRRSISDIDRNPVTKVLVYEESRITGVRARLHVGVAASDGLSSDVAIPSPSSGDRPEPIPVTPPPATGFQAEHDGVSAIMALTESVTSLTKAVNNLAEVMARQ